MKTMAPAQAEHQLTHVADRFDHWRQTRTTPAEPMPQYLWEQAIAFTTTFSIARVATRLRVSGGELKKRCAAYHAPAVEPSSTPLGFVELSATPAWPMPTLSAAVELQRTDGARLRMHYHEPQPQLVALVRTFLETP